MNAQTQNQKLLEYPMICRDGKRYGKWSLDKGAQE